jgi:membrane peptidoglycan carboxypeptidase
VLNSQRRAGGGRISAVGKLLAVSVGAGLLVAAVVVPMIGAAGVVTRNAANTFNTLKVPSLGQIPSRSEILDADGNLIAYYYPKNIYRVPVAYNQIAPVMRNAIVAIEDSRFYAHGAFDLRGTARALANDLSTSANPQGGSTLAQEYVKNALILTATSKQQQDDASEDTVARKIRELRMAAVVEHEMTKQELLAAYLNAAYYDESAYGIQVAAERYFSTSAADLTLPEAALLAGLVRNPTAYNPVYNPGPAADRRNTVLARMAQVGYITRAQAAAAEKLPLGLKMSTLPLQSGCLSASAASDAFFCDYALAVIRNNPALAAAKQMLNTVGGLKIYTTLEPQDQKAANDAVNWVAPANSGGFNPGGNVDTEVLIQPGTGKIRAIAVDRPYGSGPGQTTVDYAAPTEYDGSTGGVQTGSSSKIFTLITALKQGIPFGFNMSVVNPSVVGPFTNCQGGPVPAFQFNNAENPNPKPEIFTLYNGTTQSINIFYAQLEQKVGLCNVVKTAASMGMTFVNGGNLLKPDRSIHQESADNDSSFTLGSVPVSPMSMAAAYASVAARGMYCSPVAINQILTSSGGSLPVQSANCHQAFPAAVADAANYILQGVLISGTAGNRGISVPAAAKTGTANQGFYAAFAGYTPHLTGYVSVFNPIDPTTGGQMIGYPHACYRESPALGGGENCPGQMFGDNAPGATWQMTFSNAAVGPGTQFVGVPADSPFFSMGNGVNSPKPPKPPKKGRGGGGNGGGNGGGGNGGGNGNGNGNGGPGGPPTAGPTAPATPAPVGGPLQAPLGELPAARLP